MTPAQLKAKLDELRALPGETEWVESKRAATSFDTDEIGEYFSALSNEANLKGQAFGWLVFGVEDKTHAVVGSQYRTHRPKLDALKLEIANHTTSGSRSRRFTNLCCPKGALFCSKSRRRSAGCPPPGRATSTGAMASRRSA